ncbi:exported hypothetical protein [uncultured Desulfovibrio sp.]|uniref:Uncharacterized protein n=1 Tax=uncultured Desulfovibrio sp. TaxID=167968 RepID=A0A212IVS2_9BACT|nr:exported hypothetical protein [uncultured Desulfovibrio sp.]
MKSLPVRERGLKLVTYTTFASSVLVAPRAGAWIEATLASHPLTACCGRSPCGSVD